MELHAGRHFNLYCRSKLSQNEGKMELQDAKYSAVFTVKHLICISTVVGADSCLLFLSSILCSLSVSASEQ